MYPSNRNENSITIPCITSTTHEIHNRPFFDNDNNPNSRIDDLSSSLFHFPSPYMHYEDETVFLQQFHDIFQQQQQQQQQPHLINENLEAHNVVTNMVDSGNNNVYVISKGGDGNKKKCSHVSTTEQITRKRTSKKDRHSKINTAHGPRDRRMRLSLDVARKFFGLQDMLGFDKASRTVEWLLTNSKIAIKELTRGFPQMKKSSSTLGANSPSSTSECEVLSGIEESVSASASIQGNHKMGVAASETPSCRKDKKIRGVRKAAVNPLAKESREKARARARERTREKKRLGETKICTEAINHDLNVLGSWSPFETGEESGTHSHNLNNPPCEKPQIQEIREEILGDSLFKTGNWSPSTFFSYQQNSEISNEHQFTDLQFYGKPWEKYNN